MVRTRDLIQEALASSKRVISDVFYGKQNPYKNKDEEMYKTLYELRHMLK